MAHTLAITALFLYAGAEYKRAPFLHALEGTCVVVSFHALGGKQNSCPKEPGCIINTDFGRRCRKVSSTSYQIRDARGEHCRKGGLRSSESPYMTRGDRGATGGKETQGENCEPTAAEKSRGMAPAWYE